VAKPDIFMLILKLASTPLLFNNSQSEYILFDPNRGFEDDVSSFE
jgi:hypothetical protein